VEELTITRKVKVIPVVKPENRRTKTTTHPVSIGEMLTGFDRLSEHPQRNEIIKAVFSGFVLDPYR
jgi:hypothetical protein